MQATHKTLDIIRLGLHSLTRHKGRSALTSLGIIFGVFSVIAMLSINKGFSYESQLALRQLGSNNIIVESVKPPQDATNADQSRMLEYGLKNADVARLRGNIPGVLRCAYVHRTGKIARVANREIEVSVIGAEPDYAQVIDIPMTAGRFITDTDIRLAQAHCVITSSLARKLFRYDDPVGEAIWLGEEVFTVVGVLDKLPRSMGGGSDVGNYVIIPLATDLARFGEVTMIRTSGSMKIERVEVSQCILQMADDQGVEDGAKIARNLLARFHDRYDYEITVPLELIEQKKQQLRLWNFMFIVIASVSLLVGGIGIMNIMLASVTERTREIGVRRALGAKRRDIVTQFIVEAVTLTTAGGLVGIAIGMIIPHLVGKLLGLTTIISKETLFWPFIMAVLVGLVSGVYPATRAASLDPIEALRHE